MTVSEQELIDTIERAQLVDIAQTLGVKARFPKTIMGNPFRVGSDLWEAWQDANYEARC